MTNRDSELVVVEGLWWTLDDQQLIKDVVMKGKYISNAIKFLSNRNQISIDESKDQFFTEVSLFVNNLIRNKQLHRAIHVLKNVQLNEFYYFFDFYQDETDEETKKLLLERLNNLDSKYGEKEKVLKANHLFFRLMVSNFHKHSKYLENVNRNTGSTAINASNINKIIFGTFMKQPQNWKNELATDVFFKSKNVHLRHVLDKHCFFAFILRNEFYAILKQWLQEAYWCKAGKMIQSTISEPETFEAALLCLFREWNFEQKMMDLIARREKDVIKNDFAKLGLFESREAKFICRKLNRFFTTHTFYENFPELKTDQVTKFVIENNLMDLLPEKFIDFRYIKLLLENLDVIYMRDELVLVEKIKDLMAPETTLDNFLMMVNATSDYILEFNKSFDRNRPDLRLINETLQGLTARDFHKISDINSFTQNLMIKVNSMDEELSTIEELLESFHSINLDFIREEFEKNEGDLNVTFDDVNLSASFGDVVRLNFINYVTQHQSAFGSYLLIKDILKNFKTISRSQILIGCEEIARLAVENPDNQELVSHVITFLEIFSVDSRSLRCLLRLMKLEATGDVNEGFEAQLNTAVMAGANNDDLCNVEALEVYWETQKNFDPPRSYLNEFIKSNDWFKLVTLAQYLKFSLSSFVSICDNRITDKALRDNLIRAVLFDASPEHKKQCSFSKRRRSRTLQPEETRLFCQGKFLDMKRDLFATLLKCDETTDRHNMAFEEFQKMMSKKGSSDDLLHQAKLHDWPLLAVLAATTKLYRWKFCWITWLTLSSDYNWNFKFKTVEELAQHVVDFCLEKGFIRTLNESIAIFYPNSAFKILTSFLWSSKKGNWDVIESLLKQFIVKLSDHRYNMVAVKGKDNAMSFTMRCIIKHLQVNFHSILQQEKYLDALCESEISHFCGKVDFAFMRTICTIIERTNMQIDFEELCTHDKKKLFETAGKMCESLIDDHQFEAAIQVADLMNLPKSDFVLKWWIHMWNCEDRHSSNFEILKYMKYVNKYHLNVDVMIKFLKTVIGELEPCVKKYNMMKFVLRNSWIEDAVERETLEYEIITLYLKLKIEGEKDLKPLMSEFYENIITKDKFIIHNSLFELKSIATVDELTVSYEILEDIKELEQLDELIFYLLDAGDVVQVLRIQEMFGRAPEDLKLLVYMMSIAEGINSIYDITKEERKTISNYGLMSNKFNRLTLRSLRTGSSNSMSSSLSNDQLSESMILDDSASRNSYKENKETFQALQGLVCKMTHGVTHAQRIALIYRASLFLNKNFVELMKMKNSFELLELAASSDCENKLLVMHDIMTANQMTNDEIAEFVAKEIAASIIRTRFLQFNKDTELMIGSTSSWSPSREVTDDIWGFSLSKDLHLILELCKSTTLLGNNLLKYYGILSKETADIPFYSDDLDQNRICQHLNKMLSPQIMSLKKQNIIRVELLITAHECFCHECSTEGIGSILNLAKTLCNHLAAKKSFTLIVKLMCGIGRYREMFYCFEILIRNEQFEALLGQFTDKQTNGLKMAILSYLNEYHPNNKEFYRMATSHFMMYTELANIWRKDSLDKIDALLQANQVKVLKTGRINSSQEQQIELPYLKSSKDVIATLADALTGMIHATEMVSMDNKIDMSIKFSSFCELIAVQIHLAKIVCEGEEKICPCIINREQSAEKFQYFANYELTVPQTTILMKNTELKIDFAKALSVHLVLEDEGYLLDFMSRLELTDDMIENVVKITKLDKISIKREKFFNDLVMMVSDCRLKFRLASLLGLKGLWQPMLNDPGSYCYLLDSKYGTVDVL